MNGIQFFLADAVTTTPSLLEQLAWVASIVLAITAVIAIWQVFAVIRQARSAIEQNRIAIEQLKIMASQLEVARGDVILRSKREAIAAALDQCKRFAEAINLHIEETNKALIAKNYPFQTNVDPNFPLVPHEIDPLGVQIWVGDADLRSKIIHTLNELESFAMYFACDLADESIAFAPTALTFCQTCEYYRLFIGVFRQPDKVKLYQNLAKLYQMWKPRLERTALEEQGKLLEEKKQKLPAPKKGTPLGTDFK